MNMRELLILILITSSLIGLGTIFHSPFSKPNLYTDILGFFWYDFAEKNKMPYLDVDESGSPFEYPFFSGLLSILAWKIGVDLQGFYTVYSIIVLISAIAMSYAALNISGNLTYTLVYMVAPSLIVYGIYGYDVILTALTSLSILTFIRGRYILSAILLALGFHTKFLSILFLPYAIIKLSGRERLKYLASFGALTLTPIAVFPEAFKKILDHHIHWSLKNAWYIHIFPDAASPVGPNPAPGAEAAKLFGFIGFTLLYLYILRRELKPEQFMLLAISSYLLFTSRYSPQTNILLLPFIPALGILMPGFPVWELSNATIIFTWFTTSEPFKPWSLPQTMSLIRFIALSTMFIQSLHATGLLKPKIKIPSIAKMMILRKLRKETYKNE